MIEIDAFEVAKAIQLNKLAALHIGRRIDACDVNSCMIPVLCQQQYYYERMVEHGQRIIRELADSYIREALFNDCFDVPF